MTEQEWKTQAKNWLKSQLTLKGMSYEELANKLQAMGIEENYNSINTKINRGTFNFVFVLQCLKALGVNEVRV